ncbi:hypothetical protein [Roseospira goensis]|uniref:Uncharacterized protein n=1 Tax=Roseospira goensis TaxID=391922 RepID=A0A7W6RXH8_9PROT|nr:hypothetical protein [Roseospira goensis]MBB4284394.1 hypothetical protein [Roseospira goensis]
MLRRRATITEQWDPGFETALMAALDAAPDGAPDGAAVAWGGGRDPRRFFPALRGRVHVLDLDRLDTQEPAAAVAALRRAGVALVVTDRTLPRVAPWLEPDLSRLRVRLRDGLDTPGFAPLALSSGWALHRLVDPAAGPARPDADGAALVARARALLADPATSDTDIDDHGGGAVTVTLLRPEGGPLAERTAADLAGAVAALRRDWPALRVEAAAMEDLALPESLAAAAVSLRLGVSVARDPCLLADRDVAALPWLIDLGRDGLAAGTVAVGPEAVLADGLTSPVLHLEALLRRLDPARFLRPARSAAVARTRPQVVFEAAWRAADDVPLWRRRADAWTEPAPAAAPLRLVRGQPLWSVESVDRTALRRALALGARRLVADQRPDGSFRPFHRPDASAAPAGVPALARHVPVPLALLRAYRRLGDAALLDAAGRGLAHGLERRAQAGRRTLAFLVLTLVELAELGHLGGWRPLLAELGAALARPEAAPPERAADDADGDAEAETSGTADAVAALALARLFALAVRSGEPDSPLGPVARGAVARLRDAWETWAADRTDADGPDGGIHPEAAREGLTSAAPWLAAAAGAVFEATADAEAAQTVRTVQDWIERTVLVTPARCPAPDWLGGLFTRPGGLPTVAGCHGLMTAAAALTVARSDAEAEARRRAARLGARFCLQLQVDGPATRDALPAAVAAAVGGFRFGLGQALVRTDWSARVVMALADAEAALWPMAAGEEAAA